MITKIWHAKTTVDKTKPIIRSKFKKEIVSFSNEPFKLIGKKETLLNSFHEARKS